MLKDVHVDFLTNTVKNSKGDLVYPNNDASLHGIVQNKIIDTIKLFRDIHDLALDFLSTYPTFESLMEAQSKKKHNQNYLVNKLYANYFIIMEHPKMVNQMVESIVLEELYDMPGFINETKNNILYNEIFNTYKSKSTEEIYELMNNATAS